MIVVDEVTFLSFPRKAATIDRGYGKTDDFALLFPRPLVAALHNDSFPSG